MVRRGPSRPLTWPRGDQTDGKRCQVARQEDPIQPAARLSGEGIGPGERVALDVIGQTRFIRVRACSQPGVPPPGEMRQPLFLVAIAIVEIPGDEGPVPAVESTVAGEGLDLPHARRGLLGQRLQMERGKGEVLAIDCDPGAEQGATGGARQLLVMGMGDGVAGEYQQPPGWLSRRARGCLKGRVVSPPMGIGADQAQKGAGDQDHNQAQCQQHHPTDAPPPAGPGHSFAHQLKPEPVLSSMGV